MNVKWYMGQARKMEEANDGTQGGSGGGIQTVDFNDPTVKAAFEERLAQEVNGLKNKNTELLDKLKIAKETSTKLEGVDVEELLKLKKTLETNEEMKLMADGKIEEVVSRRVENLQRDHEDKISSLSNKMAEMQELLQQKEDKLATLLIDGSVRESYIELGYEPAALDDVLRFARTVFKMDETGKPVPRSEDGSVIFGKDGKSPISQREWLEALAVKKPYLKPVSKGTGSTSPRFGSPTFDKTTASSKDLYKAGLEKLGFGN